jgi:hypothetical protein
MCSRARTRAALLQPNARAAARLWSPISASVALLSYLNLIINRKQLFASAKMRCGGVDTSCHSAAPLRVFTMERQRLRSQERIQSSSSSLLFSSRSLLLCQIKVISPTKGVVLNGPPHRRGDRTRPTACPRAFP